MLAQWQVTVRSAIGSTIIAGVIVVAELLVRLDELAEATAWHLHPGTEGP